MTTLSYKINNYRITLTHNENIYIKVIDEISLQTYENNIDLNEINVPFDRNDILNLIIDCLSLKENFNVSFVINQNCMKIIFDILFNLKYKYNFDVILNEKKINNNAKTECQYIKEIEELEYKLNELNEKFEKSILIQEQKNQELINIIENIGYLNKTIYSYVWGKQNYTINMKELSLSSYTINSIDYPTQSKDINDENTLKCFYRLEKLCINSIGNKDNGRLKINKAQFQNNTLKTLKLNNCLIDTFEFIHGFPILEEITFERCFCYEFNINNKNYLLLHKNIKRIFISGENTNDPNKQYDMINIANRISLICKEINIEFKVI